MSILLDALRKSEKSQKPVDPPTIHGNDHQFQEPRSIKSSHIVLVIVVALALIGWLLWQQYHGDSSGYTPPVELPTGKTTSKVPRVPGKTKAEPAKQEPAPEQPAAGQVAAEQVAAKQGAAERVAAAPKGSQAGDGRARTPVEVFEMTTRAYSDMTPEEKEAARELRRSQAAAVRARRAAEKRQNSAAAKTASAKAAAAKAEKRGSGPLPAESEQASTTESLASSSQQEDEYHSPEPEPISYWELPDSVRRGVPEIKFSVLVYAENPANRFVLVNGERLVEGQSLSPGVEVEEIRREGVIFSYQMYQFFVKR